MKMKAETKRKSLFWLFKGIGVAISCALPLWAVCTKFPIWTETHGSARSIGAGGIIGIVVLLVVFRKTIFGYLEEKLNLKHAPPMMIWVVLLIIAYCLMFLSKFLYDITTVFWLGFLGCSIGSVLTFIAEYKFGEKKKDEDNK